MRYDAQPPIRRSKPSTPSLVTFLELRPTEHADIHLAFPRQFILTPSAALDPPVPAELAARFPDWPAGAISTLLADHEDEITLLNTYIDEADLNRRVREVSELVERDLKSERDEDVAM